MKGSQEWINFVIDSIDNFIFYNKLWCKEDKDLRRKHSIKLNNYKIDYQIPMNISRLNLRID